MPDHSKIDPVTSPSFAGAAGQAALVDLDTDRVVADVSPLLFGTFLEHLGRAIYGGVYQPESPQADEHGFRRDVLAALRELAFTIYRYPGGNYVSGCDWKDGIGPKTQRPRRRDLAWRSIETNQFGTDEFIDFCRLLGAQPMLGMNFGTGSIKDAADLVEYCNAPAGTAWADRRVANGHPAPHDVRFWCLGNEMDGPWQIGQLSADEYGRKARQAAKLMKYHDPALQLIVCGSSNDDMASYPDWDRIVLEHTYEHIDYLSMHHYAANDDNNTADYLAYGLRLQRHLETIAAVIRYVKARSRATHDVFIAWDEWNVWYRQRQGHGRWQQAPPLLEEIYNLEDALVVSQWLNLFLRRCDIIRMANLAQAVNVIAPILVHGEQLLKQTIFYPLMLYRRYAVGQALDVLVRSPHYAAPRYGLVPLLDASATFDPATGQGAVFLVNRGQSRSLNVQLRWHGHTPQRITQIYTLSGDDAKSANSFQQPDLICPRLSAGPPIHSAAAAFDLPPLSLTVAITTALAH